MIYYMYLLSPWVKDMCIHKSEVVSDFYLRLVWPLGIIVACVCVVLCMSSRSPRDNLWPIQARISKFGPEVQSALDKIHIVLGVDWYWPSWSNLTSNSLISGFCTRLNTATRINTKAISDSLTCFQRRVCLVGLQSLVRHFKGWGH